jgi:hypothetical protein
MPDDRTTDRPAHAGCAVSSNSNRSAMSLFI